MTTFESDAQDKIEDFWNYKNPDYADRIEQRGPASPFCDADPTATAWPLFRRYEDYFKSWQQILRASKFEDVAASVLVAHGEKTEDTLVASSSQLAEVLGEINNLAFKDEEDEFGPVRPTYHALKHCMKLVLDLAAKGKLYAPTDITTDHNGDIRITWSKGNREAELVCTSEGRPYIYYSSDKTFGTEEDITADRVAEKVRWATDLR
jgi:hypothetical protein